jgi:hypothetical protein
MNGLQWWNSIYIEHAILYILKKIILNQQPNFKKLVDQMNSHMKYI